MRRIGGYTAVNTDDEADEMASSRAVATRTKVISRKGKRKHAHYNDAENDEEDALLRGEAEVDVEIASAPVEQILLAARPVRVSSASQPSLSLYISHAVRFIVS